MSLIFFWNFVLIILIILSVSFLTLLERLMISLSQNRLGPNKTSVFGFFQCFFDGLKILKKENFFLKNMNYMILFISYWYFFMSFWFYFLIFSKYYIMNLKYCFIVFMIYVSFYIYFNMFFSFSSKSKYPFLGFMRFNNQSISFEILFFFVVFILINMNLCFNINNMFNLFLFYLVVFFIFIFLTEMNRSPFDFSESESELVSGFNTEFLSLNFVFLFLGEYNMILFFSVFFSILFSLKIMFIMLLFIFILIRSCYPRFRFDYLMSVFWLFLMVLVMNFTFMFIIFMK